MTLSTNRLHHTPTATATPKKVNHPCTPLRIKTPRMSPSPLRFPHSTPRRRRTPSTDPGDRFIPNRNLFDPAQSRASLLSNIEEDENISPAKVASVEYKRNLRRTLFGTEEPSSLLGFGDSAKKSTKSNHPSFSVKDSFSLDPLRHIDSTLPTTQSKRLVSTAPHLDLDLPDVIPDPYVNVMSVGPALAVALRDTLFLSRSGIVSSIRFPNNLVTSVKWSSAPGEALLAVGIHKEAQVWDINTTQQISWLHNHKDCVSALEWRGSNDLLAASESGIQQYDIRLHKPEVTEYRAPLQFPVTKMQWEDNLLAVADGDSIFLWDTRYPTKLLRTLEHKRAMDLEFCPMQRNVLATGGSNGIHFWNVQSGNLRTTIPTPAPVNSILWSPYRKEMMAAYGDVMGIWSLSNGVERLVEFGPNLGEVLSLDRRPSSGRVYSVHAKEHLFVWEDVFGDAPARPKMRLDAEFGSFEMPVVR